MLAIEAVQIECDSQIFVIFDAERAETDAGS